MRSAVRVFAAAASLLLLGPRADAQHLWWDVEGEQDATCLYGTVTVLATYRDIYYCGANWHPGEPAGGYCGIQHNTERERRTIFSIWDTSPQLHPKCTEADPEAMIDRFGGEGEGEHTHMVWPWKVGETFQFFLRKQEAEGGDATDVRYYVYDRGSKRWRHVSTIRTPNGGHRSVGTIGGGLNSFLENFSGKEKGRPKLALYRLWLGRGPDEMRPLTKAGGDGIWGQLDDSYFLAEGEPKKLDVVFRNLEKRYGKPARAREGQALPPLTARPIPAGVVEALKSLPRAEALQQHSDDPRADGTYIIRNVTSRKGPAIGRDSRVYLLAVSRSRVVWKLRPVGDAYLIVNTANGLVLDGSADRPAQVRQTGAAGQLWSFVKSGDAYYIRCQATGRVLDVSGGSTEDGTAIVMWDMKESLNNSNQLWKLTESNEK